MPHTRSRTRCSLCSCMGLLPSRFSVYLRGSATPNRDQGPDTIADIEFRSRSSHWNAKRVYSTERGGAIGTHPAGFAARFDSCRRGARTGTPGRLLAEAARLSAGRPLGGGYAVPGSPPGARIHRPLQGAACPVLFAREDPFGLLARCGWRSTVHTMPEEGVRLGRPWPVLLLPETPPRRASHGPARTSVADVQLHYGITGDHLRSVQNGSLTENTALLW
jgi:hypothetical protein